MRRLVIAVDPPLLATSLAEALAGPLLEVIVRNGATEGSYRGDVAIVSGARPADVIADVVISLPDEEGGSGVAMLWRSGAVEPVRIGSFADLVRVVEGSVAA